MFCLKSILFSNLSTSLPVLVEVTWGGKICSTESSNNCSGGLTSGWPSELIPKFAVEQKFQTFNNRQNFRNVDEFAKLNAKIN